MTRIGLLSGEDREHAPYVYRSKAHQSLREAVAATNDPVLIFGKQAGMGVTRVLQEFRKEVAQMAPTTLPMAASVPFDFARLEPTGGSIRALVSLRNDLVLVADAVRAAHKSTSIPLFPDSKFRHFDTLFELCWIGAIKREQGDAKPKLHISRNRQRTRSITRYVVKLASGGLADIALESDELLSIFQSVLNDVAADGASEITEQAFARASQEYRDRARTRHSYFNQRHRAVFDAAFPLDKEPNLDGMLDLLTLIFTDAFVELVVMCRSASDVYIVLDALDEFNGVSRAEVRIRDTIASLLTDPAIEACGVALGSRKKPHRWIEEFLECANRLAPLSLDDLTKQNVEMAWSAQSVDGVRAQSALKKAFPGSRTLARACHVAAAWEEAGAGR